MKKLLILLMVVAVAFCLSAGCFVEPSEGEGEGEGEGEVEICPTVSVTSQVVVEGKTYIKGGEQTITVTFTLPTEPVAVYVGFGLKLTIEELLQTEVVMYPNTDKTEYTGDFTFGEDEDNECGEAYIYVETCGTCAPCKYPYTVDTEEPYVKLKVEVSGDSDDCPCGGCCLTISSVVEGGCDPDVECCGDDCSGLASWSFRIFDEPPWSECCDTGCEEAIFEDSGVGCPIKITTACLDSGEYYYAILSLVDEVGNRVDVAGAFEVSGGNGDCYLDDADPYLPPACDEVYDDYDDLCYNDDYPLIIIDPSGTMPEECLCNEPE